MAALLQVPLERFPAEVRSRTGRALAYVSPGGLGALATASGDGATIVSCTAPMSVDALSAHLAKMGIETRPGHWRASDAVGEAGEQRAPAYVVAVGYRSGESKPGVWVNSYPSEPTAAEVLRDLYDEFVENGEVGDVSFEEFLRFSHPNVIVVSPSEIDRYLLRSQEPCA